MSLRYPFTDKLFRIHIWTKTWVFVVYSLWLFFGYAWTLWHYL